MLSLKSRLEARRAIGRPPERLTLEEGAAFAGKTIALEVYTPETLPLRRIEAIADSVEECMAQLAQRGLDPRNFEFSVLKAPF